MRCPKCEHMAGWIKTVAGKLHRYLCHTCAYEFYAGGCGK